MESVIQPVAETRGKRRYRTVEKRLRVVQETLADGVSGAFSGQVNIRSEEMVTINGMAETIMEIAGKKLSIKHISGPLGVRGRNPDNRLIQEKLRWAPSRTLREGLEKTYAWIFEQVEVMQSIK